MDIKDYVIICAVYIIIGIAMGALVYNNVKSLTHRKRRNGSIICGVIWPLVIGLFLAMLLEDLNDWFVGRKDNKIY